MHIHIHINTCYIYIYLHILQPGVLYYTIQTTPSKDLPTGISLNDPSGPTAGGVSRWINHDWLVLSRHSSAIYETISQMNSVSNISSNRFYIDRYIPRSNQSLPNISGPFQAAKAAALPPNK